MKSERQIMVEFDLLANKAADWLCANTEVLAQFQGANVLDIYEKSQGAGHALVMPLVKLIDDGIRSVLGFASPGAFVGFQVGLAAMDKARARLNEDGESEEADRHMYELGEAHRGRLPPPGYRLAWVELFRDETNTVAPWEWRSSVLLTTFDPRWLLVDGGERLSDVKVGNEVVAATFPASLCRAPGISSPWPTLSPGFPLSLTCVGADAVVFGGWVPQTRR